MTPGRDGKALDPSPARHDTGAVYRTGVSRRTLLAAGAAAWLAPWTLRDARAARRARVIVVGGGFAGSTCAVTLKRLQPSLDVVLVDDTPRAITGPMSNAMLVGLRDREVTTRTLDGLDALGIRRVTAGVGAIDPVDLRVRDAHGSWQQADRLVVAPGIDFAWDGIEGLDATSSEAMPHAWRGDASALAFARRFAALDDGATLLIVAPPNPYRCPPGPYERASLCAWAMRRRGTRSKILIADAKDDFSKRGLFQLAWDLLHPGTITWIPRAAGGTAVAVERDGRAVTLANGERVRADLVCAIPAQRAAAICREADLTDASGWCPVDARDFQSLRHRGVHVIGDAAIALPMPKSAFAANSQAKACAVAIVASLAGREMPSPKLVNTCYSLVSPTQAISVSGVYGLAGGRLSALAEGMSPITGDQALREREAVDARAGYRSLVADSFRQIVADQRDVAGDKASSSIAG